MTTASMLTTGKKLPVSAAVVCALVEYLADGAAIAGTRAGAVNWQILRETEGEWFPCCERALGAAAQPSNPFRPQWLPERVTAGSRKADQHRLTLRHRAHRIGVHPDLLRQARLRVEDLLAAGCDARLLEAVLPLGATDARVRVYAAAGLEVAEAARLESAGTTSDEMTALMALAGLRTTETQRA